MADSPTGSSANSTTQAPSLNFQSDFSATLYLVGICAGIFFLFVILVLIVIAISMGIYRVAPVTPAPDSQGDSLQLLLQNIEEFEYEEQCSHSAQSMNNDTASCAICLSSFRFKDSCRRMPPPCLHIFHKKCIDKWFGQSSDCPLCKRSIPKLLEAESQALV